MLKHSLRYLGLLLSTLGLVACAGLGKAKPAPAMYDFGWMHSTNDAVSSVPVEPITSPQALHHQHIRYRLAYDNPAQVFAYAESRWASPPDELMTQRMRAGQSAPTLNGCRLAIQLDMFDHVFDTPDKSHALVQLQATLINKKTRQALGHKQFQSTVEAKTHDARGGVAALSQGASEALNAALVWSNALAESNADCKASL